MTDATLVPERISDDNLRKHLDFIQAIITRMNANSFQIKVVSITIVSALLTLSGTSKNFNLIFIAIFPVLIFWSLDAYYMQQERKFRALYSDVAGITQVNKVMLFDMPVHLYKGKKTSYTHVFMAPAIAGFYLSVIFLLVIAGIITVWI